MKANDHEKTTEILKLGDTEWKSAAALPYNLHSMASISWAKTNSVFFIGLLDKHKYSIWIENPFLYSYANVLLFRWSSRNNWFQDSTKKSRNPCFWWRIMERDCQTTWSWSIIISCYPGGGWRLQRFLQLACAICHIIGEIKATNIFKECC